MSSIARITNLVISSVVGLMAFIRELGVIQISSFLLSVSQLTPMYGLLIQGILSLADFVVVFLILSLVFDRFESRGR